MTELDRVEEKVRAKVEYRLGRWADWIAKMPGVGFSATVSWLHERSDVSNYDSRSLIDTLDEEGLATDKAICTLPEIEKTVIIVFWTRRTTLDTMCRRCRCSRSTFYRRLARAYERLYQEFTEK